VLSVTHSTSRSEILKYYAYYLELKEGTRKTRTGNTSHRRVWKCGECRKQFSVLVSTIFEDSCFHLSRFTSQQANI
jgi:hypothetical protein